MNLTKKQYREAFVESGGMEQEEFEKLAKFAKAKKMSIYEAALEKSILTDLQAGQLLAEFFGTGFINLNQIQIDKQAALRIPEEFGKAQQVIPILEDKAKVKIATSTPKDILLHSTLEKYLRKEVLFVFATPLNIADNLRVFKEDTAVIFKRILESQEGADRLGTTIIELVDVMIDHAHQRRASDIHIEPEDDYTMIRFRIDGILHDVTKVPKHVHDNIVTRIKVMARLATDVHRAAQDGKINFRTPADDEVEIRVSVVPTTDGEKVVMRLLSASTRSFQLTELGMTPEDLARFSDDIKKPWGMILITGPTGSGKTTTLYSAMRVLNKREVNVSTIEDPVEYDMDGINQIQVNTKTDLTFAKGLRSIVRQDPDIIMVGEIRDTETASIAVNAALTGHLVLSTLHTNNASTAFPRLQDMGVEDFLIASTILSVVAQRLVRKICTKCIQSQELTTKDLKLIQNIPRVKKALLDILNKKKLSKNIRFFKGKGCKVCHHTGFLGRIGIFETLTVDDVIREGIMKGLDADKLQMLAEKKGMRTMLYDGLEKVTRGITTLEEVMRVTK